MKFVGLIKSSFVDYPENVAAVVFTNGCNLNCWYCHNKQLISGTSAEEIFEENEILEFLKKRVGLLDGVVITGGEPTMHSDLKDFIIKVRLLGFKIKLDTNGTNPTALKTLLDENLLDFVAMDIKTDFENYEKICGKCCVENIYSSVKILLNCKIDYEFRTTFAPDVSFENIENICKDIKLAKRYVIQKYNPPSEKITKIPHGKSDYENALKIAKKYVKNSILRSL